MRVLPSFALMLMLILNSMLMTARGQVMITAASPQPSSTNTPFKFLFAGALEFGGESIAEIAFADGSTQKMMAGQGGSIYAGGQVRLTSDDKWFLKGLVGYKYLTTKATNTAITLTRVPIRITGMYKVTPKFWLGGGVVAHTLVKFNGGSIAANENLKSSPGGIIDIGYSHFSFSYTSMKYQDQLNKTYNAQSFGLFVYIPVEKKKR